jgi:hypothetical protein
MKIQDLDPNILGKDWDYSEHQRIICFSNKIYIPLARFLYFRITKVIPKESYPRMRDECTVSVKIFVVDEKFKYHPFLFNDVTHPSVNSSHVSFISQNEEKYELINHYFPTENLISLEILDKKTGEDL